MVIHPSVLPVTDGKTSPDKGRKKVSNEQRRDSGGPPTR